MMESGERGGRAPDLSLIVPCYNEEDVAEFTIRRLLDAFEKRGHVLEVVAVDNGSSDRTGEILNRLASEHPNVIPHRVELNEGYGKGVLRAIPLCTGRWTGPIPADGQVDAEDVVRLFEAADATNGRVLAKVRRRFRMDGLKRKVVSIAYNFFFRALWPKIASLDINGSPKIFPRSYLTRMDLESYDWCLDPEMMVKAHHMGLRVLEVNVFARMRGGGTSHVRTTTIWLFLSRLLGVRFFGAHGGWKHDPPPPEIVADPVGKAGSRAADAADRGPKAESAPAPVQAGEGLSR